SGLECCSRLRAEPGLRDLPVALFSQWLRPEDVASALEAGADFIVSKELLARPNDCRERLDELLAWTLERRLPVELRLDDLPGSVGPMLERFHKVRRGPALGALGEEVVRVLITRASSAGTGIMSDMINGDVSPEAMSGFIVAFAEQVWRVLGTTSSVPMWRAL